jgi:NADH-quinone oxidoreductase subunit N
VFAEAWVAGYEWLVIVAVLASVIAFAFYLRIIVMMYMAESDEPELVVPAMVKLVLAAAVITTILWGVLPGSLLDLATDALPL